MTSEFLHSISRIRTSITAFITDSVYVQVQLSDFLSDGDHEVPVHPLPLAQDVLHHAQDNVTSEESAAQGITRLPHFAGMKGISNSVRSLVFHPFVLCVGTFEARKNHWRIAQAWLAIATRHSSIATRIIFAGRPGSGGEPFLDLMKSTGNLWGWATVLTNPSDRELDFLYRNCEFTIFASLAEGWGLPVGESLSYGKTAVVAQSTSLPEVGGNLVLYCDPMSIDSIFSACFSLLSDTAGRQHLEGKISATTLRSWADVAQDLLRITQMPDLEKTEDPLL
jgi:glycosyltransferase involved in cell wall biosynthesis